MTLMLTQPPETEARLHEMASPHRRKHEDQSDFITRS